MYGETRDGLGQSDTRYLGARDTLLRMINHWRGQLALYRPTPAVVRAQEELAKAEQWFRASVERFYREGNNRTAMESVTVGIRHAHNAAEMIQRLSPADRAAERAQAEAQRGASVIYQAEQQITGAFTEPLARALDTISPAAGMAVRSNWWIVPIVGGSLLVLLLRR